MIFSQGHHVTLKLRFIMQDEPNCPFLSYWALLWTLVSKPVVRLLTSFWYLDLCLRIVAKVDVT
jgi:hypothetical protein